MKNLKTLLYCSMFTLVVTSIKAQCPITFPNGDICIDGTTSPLTNKICFKNNAGNLNLFFDTKNKFNFYGNDLSNNNCGFGMGRLPDNSQDGFRIDYNNVDRSGNNSAYTYFRSFSNSSYVEFGRSGSSGYKGVFGIDSNGANNLLYLFGDTNNTNVQLSAANNGINYFINKVGIGKTNPSEMLEVNGNAIINGAFIKLSPSANDAVIQRGTTGNLIINSGGGVGSAGDTSLYLNYASSYNAGTGGAKLYDGGTTNLVNLKIVPTIAPTTGSTAFLIAPSSGKTVITGEASPAGTPLPTIPATPDGYALYVTKGILTEKVKVAVRTSSNWSDYVFDKEYKLLPLTEVEKYISKNKHLPNVPSSEELVKDGLNLGEMQAKQMEKIEELTLYMIEMKKQIDILKEENIKLKKEISVKK